MTDNLLGCQEDADEEFVSKAGGKPLLPVEDSLAARATRIAFNRLLQHFARLLVGLCATPLIVTGLGTVHYGAWLVLQQAVSYLGALDFQAMGTLRYRLALSQHDANYESKRRLIGAALVLWFLMVVPLGLATMVLVYFAPIIVAVTRDLEADVRGALIISAMAIAFNRLVSLPANVLRGINHEYGAEAASVVAILIGGALSVVAVSAGWGLTGLSAAGIAGAALVGAVQYRVMRRVCPWVGFAWPSRREVVGFAKLSGALLGSGLSLFLLLSTDVILAAHVMSLESAALLGTTGAALRFSVEPLQQLLSSSSAGIVGLCGRGEWRRVVDLRTELQWQSVAFVGWLGSCIVLLNEGFLSLWLGAGYFGGTPLTITLVLLALITVLLRNDGILLDAMGLLREKSALTLVGCAVSIGCAVLGGLHGALTGIVIGLCTGRLFVYFGQRQRLASTLRGFGVVDVPGQWRITLASLGLLAVSGYAARFLVVESWVEFIVYGVIAGLVFAAGIGVVGLRGSERMQLKLRLRQATLALASRLKRGH